MAATVPAEISALSKEYLTISLTSDVDPLTLGTVEVAFTSGRDVAPIEADWHTAAIEDSTVVLLLGPGGGVEPGVGYWLVWTRMVDAPEVPVEPTGYLRIY